MDFLQTFCALILLCGTGSLNFFKPGRASAHQDGVPGGRNAFSSGFWKVLFLAHTSFSENKNAPCSCELWPYRYTSYYDHTGLALLIVLLSDWCCPSIWSSVLDRYRHTCHHPAYNFIVDFLADGSYILSNTN